MLSYHKIGTIAFLALLVSACGTAAAEPLPACPASPVRNCVNDSSPRVCAEAGGSGESWACWIPAGFLSTDCAMCPANSGVCAVDGDKVTCSVFGGTMVLGCSASTEPCPPGFSGDCAPGASPIGSCCYMGNTVGICIVDGGAS